MADANSKNIQIGKTWYGPTDTIDSNDLAGVQREGEIRVFKVRSKSDRTSLVTGGDMVCMLVRNAASFNLVPGRMVTWQSGYYKRRVDGYSRTTGAVVAGVVDPYLISTGVRQYDLFWLVVKGLCLLKTDLAGGANNLLPEGTVLVSLTAASSGATTAGRVAPQDLTGATSVLGGQLQNAVGVAMSAKTTNNTDADILVDLQLPWA